MQLVSCNVSLSPPPPALGVMFATLGEFTEFRVAFNRIRGSVTLIYGEKRKRRTRRKTPRAVKGGPKSAAQLPVAVPFVSPSPAQPGMSSSVDQNRRVSTKIGGTNRRRRSLVKT